MILVSPLSPISTQVNATDYSFFPLNTTKNRNPKHGFFFPSLFLNVSAFSDSLTILRKATFRLCCTSSSSSSSSSNSSSSVSKQEEEEEEEEEEYHVLTAMKSKYNEIIIVDTPKARMLLLDSTHNVHSILYKADKWTRSYWDEFASLPAIIPKGPIAILGLGAGTVAHLLLDCWPSLQLEGWEIDEILIDKARGYFGLSDLERHNQAGGILNVHTGDALCPSGTDFGRYAGIVVDLFCDGKVLAELQEVGTWLTLNERLMPDGRIMVNCGGMTGVLEDVDGRVHSKSNGGSEFENSTIKALSEAFPTLVSWKRMPESGGANYLALTGTLPDLTLWSTMVPDRLSEAVKQWRPCGPAS